jgi:hypothetical protein
MAVTAVFESKLTVVQTLEGDFVAPADNTVSITGLNETETYTGATAVPVTKQSAFEQALTAGAATINLAALPGLTAEETVVGTGLKVQLAKFRNLDANANAITVAVGASNGHTLMGAAWTFTLQPGQSITFKGDEAAPDIGAADRTIDITGTGAQILECQFVLG